jgi:hypothetical protein
VGRVQAVVVKRAGTVVPAVVVVERAVVTVTIVGTFLQAVKHIINTWVNLIVTQITAAEAEIEMVVLVVKVVLIILAVAVAVLVA